MKTPEKRAAWEALAGPVDWEKAKALEPRGNEHFDMPRTGEPDILLTAEAGVMHEFVGEGRYLKGELGQAVAEVKATVRSRGPHKETTGGRKTPRRRD